MSQEPAWLTRAAREGGAPAASSARRAGCPQRTSGDEPWAAPTSVTREVQS